MTRKELDDWKAKAKFVTCIRDEYDSGANWSCGNIYERDGRLFRLETYNGHPELKWTAGLRRKDDYAEPLPVEKKTRTETYYDSITETKITT